MEKYIDGNFFWLDGFIAGLEDHCPAFPFITKWYDLRESAPETQNIQKRAFCFGLGFDLRGGVLGNDLVEGGIVFFDLFKAMMDKRDEIDGILYGYDYTGAILGVL